MKNVYLSLLLLSAIFTNAQVVFESSLAETFKKAKEQNKPVFIEYYNSDCSVCIQLGKLLKEDAEVSAHYNTNFVNYAMNTYDTLSAEDNAFMEEANLHFESVPVLLFFDKDKNFMHHSGVKVNSDVIIGEAKKAVSENYNSLGSKRKYEAGDRSVRTLYAYSDLLKINKNDELLKQVAEEMFESFNKAELPTKKSYIILKNVVTSTDNGFFQYWMDNIEELKGFEKGANEGTEKSHMQTIVLRELTDPYIKNWDKEKIKKFKKYIVKLKITDNPDVFFEKV